MKKRIITGTGASALKMITICSSLAIVLALSLNAQPPPSGIGQNNTGLGQNSTGIGQNNTSIGRQNNAGVNGQNNTAITGQNNTGIGVQSGSNPQNQADTAVGVGGQVPADGRAANDSRLNGQNPDLRGQNDTRLNANTQPIFGTTNGFGATNAFGTVTNGFETNGFAVGTNNATPLSPTGQTNSSGRIYIAPARQ